MDGSALQQQQNPFNNVLHDENNWLSTKEISCFCFISNFWRFVSFHEIEINFKR